EKRLKERRRFIDEVAQDAREVVSRAVPRAELLDGERRSRVCAARPTDGCHGADRERRTIAHDRPQPEGASEGAAHGVHRFAYSENIEQVRDVVDPRFHGRLVEHDRLGRLTEPDKVWCDNTVRLSEEGYEF